MGRWTQYDEDDYRLPEGMKRIGYDADTMRYCFRDEDDSVWQGSEGAEFGEMTKVGSSVSPHHNPNHHRRRRRRRSPTPSSTEHSRPMADRSAINTRSYRTLFPFSLLSPSSFSSWSILRDLQFPQENDHKAHHVIGPSPATVAEKHRKRIDGRSKITKKSIQMSFVTLSRRVSAKLSSLRVKPLRPSTA